MGALRASNGSAVRAWRRNPGGPKRGVFLVPGMYFPARVAKKSMPLKVDKGERLSVDNYARRYVLARSRAANGNDAHSPSGPRFASK